MHTRAHALAPLAVLALSLALGACAPVVQRAGIPSEWRPSPNFNERRPDFVILHHTSDDKIEQALATLTDPLREVSAHYLIGRDGNIIQLVDERARAWHAGESKWGGETDINSASLGIELDNNGHEPFAEAQIAALERLLADIVERYHLPSANVLGHGDVAPRRKTDPSRYFPWKLLAERGFGLWCDSPLPTAPADMDVAMALRAVGYDTADLPAAIQAFRRHFQGEEASGPLDAGGRALLYCLYLKSAR